MYFILTLFLYNKWSNRTECTVSNPVLPYVRYTQNYGVPPPSTLRYFLHEYTTYTLARCYCCLRLPPPLLLLRTPCPQYDPSAWWCRNNPRDAYRLSDLSFLLLNQLLPSSLSTSTIGYLNSVNYQGSCLSNNDSRNYSCVSSGRWKEDGKR